MEKKIIILGTAHGVNVAGKRSPDGKFREYKYSREIVAELKKQLEAEGFTVYVDITTDEVKLPQVKELSERCSIVNALCKKHGTANCIYVSIHVNAAGSGEWLNARGWSVYTTRGVTKADALATCLWNEANAILPHDHKTALRSDYSDGDPDKEANFYVLKNTACPAFLTENLFQDNKEDVAYLTSDEGRKAIVEIHKKGIINYCNK